MSQSTSLESLGGGDVAGPPADEERVRRILSEMNAGDSSPEQGSRIISEGPITTSTGEIRMDPRTARAHIIGGAAPTMADFQSMLFQTPPGMNPLHGGPEPPQRERISTKVAEPVSMWSMLLQQIRAPAIVALIVFFINLPVITTILSRYASWMYLGSGEISIAGLIVKSLIAAGLFAFYQILSGLFQK